MKNGNVLVMNHCFLGKQLFEMIDKYFKRVKIDSKGLEYERLSKIAMEIPFELLRGEAELCLTTREGKSFFEIYSKVEAEQYKKVDNIENQTEFLEKIKRSRKKYKEQREKLIEIISIKMKEKA